MWPGVAFDVDGFLATLPSRGVSAAQVAVYRDAVAILLAAAGDRGFGPAELDDALAREAHGGASERRLANLRLVGTEMITFVRSAAETLLGGPPFVPPSSAFLPPVDAPQRLELAIDPPRPAPAVAPVEVAMPPRAAPVEVAHRPARASLEVAVAPPPPAGGSRWSPLAIDPPPLPGCICATEREVYLDDYWQNLWQMVLGVMCVIGLAVTMTFSITMALVIAFGLGTVGAIIAALTVGWRCEHCRHWIARRALDAEQRGLARRRALVFAAIAGVLTVAFVFAGRELQREREEQRAVDRALRTLQDPWR